MYLSLSDWRSNKASNTSRAAKVAFKASPTVIALGIVSMLTDISSESVAAILPMYITGALGLSMIAYGFFEGLNQSASALVRIAAGYAADQTSRPKPVAVAGYGLSMVARIGLLFATGFAGIAAIIGVDRVGKGIRTAPRDAMIQQASQPEHLARSFGLHRLLDTIGATAGPMLAFVVLLLVPDGYRAVFVLSLAVAILGVAVLVLVVPNRKLGAKPVPAAQSRTAAAEPERSIQVLKFKPLLRMLSRGRMGRMLCAAGLLGLLTVGDGFVYLALMAHGTMDYFWFPLLFVGSNLVFLLLAIPLGKLADRTSRAAVFVAGHLALAVAYLCASGGGSLFFIVSALAALGLFYAATDGVLAALAGQLSPEGSVSTGIGAAQTVVAVARLLSATGFGVLWVLFGSNLALLGVAALLLLAVPLAWYLLLGKASRPIEENS
ncbi:MFS transporter [Glutamicibacter protophormiae]|uniref:MFS family permease n=1 Tax=Glutamicibacter protophormiae TaxID=37930 RepID=A0ABS4XSB1_GLUPR|nr:MFS transporter [Glutamicibacter protophormiae]MBP2399393.1 MFS family permease [Glutamicibacter protophormiae]GGL85187.1 MFS transporter [Glutamicibacter protophormiae]